MSVTVELRGEMDVGYDYARKDARALINYLAQAGVLDITPDAPAGARVRADPARRRGADRRPACGRAGVPERAGREGAGRMTPSPT
ncbi:hypothetical protein LP419_25030 [Massilia sp. H-1]|nr:hypothetical protein LP419_25030 [Massilia sp. H-1]